MSMLERDKDRYKTFSRRAFLIGAGKLGFLGVLGARLGYLQVKEAQKYKTLSDNNRINMNLMAPSRGLIRDRKGVVLADNIQNFRVNIISEQTESPKKTLEDLAKIIKLEKHEINKVLSDISKVRRFVPVQVKENLGWDDVAKVEVHLPELPGLFIEEGEIRRYQHKKSTAHLIGYVGLVNATEIEQGDPVLTVPGFRVGKTGIEKALDPVLRGRAGSIKREVDARGRIVRTLEKDFGQKGATVDLTIDAEFQDFTQTILDREKSASAVVMNAKNGALYSLASSPSFDPNMFSKSISATDWERLLNNPAKPLTNKAIAGQYPPGSTFKMVTAMAALEAGVIDHNTTHHCPGHLDMAGHRFHCWKKAGHGRMNLVEALSQSCDVFFYKISSEVGIQRIAEMSKRMGLGQILPLDIANVRPGLVPTKEWKLSHHGQTWRTGETVLASIGQGYLQTTPLQLATMTARMINGGYAVRPALLKEVNSRIPVQAPHTNWPRLTLEPDHLKLVKRGMDRAVNHTKGTAHRVANENPNYLFGGKTGTAQVRRISRQDRLDGFSQKDLPWRQRHHALFVGYAPVKDPEYVCAVVVEHGESGSAAAAPIARDLLTKAMKMNLSKDIKKKS